MLCHLISMFSKLNFEEDTFYNFPHVCRYSLPLAALTNKLSSSHPPLGCMGLSLLLFEHISVSDNKYQDNRGPVVFCSLKSSYPFDVNRRGEMCSW